MRLPRTLDDLRGLRCARWTRESTAGQVDRFGPDAQREQQDRAIERYGLVDTGLAWSVAHSGRTIASTSQFGEMLAAAGTAYDVLLVGYVSRFARDLRTAVNARHELHAAGASLLFCDERVLSSDEDAWEQWAREAVEAEAYSRRLAKRTSEGYAAKFRRGDQGGSPPRGFRRVPPQMTLAIDPSTIGEVVRAFEMYATGTVSLNELEGQTGIDRDGLRAMLVNPIYNGWVRRHRRRHDEQRSPAAWRDSPPVSDELWARVQEIREVRYHGGGHPTPVHAHLLTGRLFCPGCGARIRADGHRRYRHHRPCAAWPQHTVSAVRFEEVISAQVTGIRHDAAMLVNLRRLAASSAPRPDSTSLRRRQLERELAHLAVRHAKRSLSTEAYLAEHERITGAIDSLTEHHGPVVDPDEAIAYLRDLPRLWREMSPEGRADLARSIYERVWVTSEGVTGVELNPDQDRHLLALAMPQRVTVGARPEGARQTLTVPIVGRRAWLRLVRTA